MDSVVPFLLGHDRYDRKRERTSTTDHVSVVLVPTIMGSRSFSFVPFWNCDLVRSFPCVPSCPEVFGTRPTDEARVLAARRALLDRVLQLNCSYRPIATFVEADWFNKDTPESCSNFLYFNSGVKIFLSTFQLSCLSHQLS